MEWYFRSADATEALRERRAFSEYLRTRCTPESDCMASEIVYGELVANVVQHAPGPIEIMLRSNARHAVTIEVYDTASNFRITRLTEPSLDSESGRGLYIIWRLCGNVSRTKTLNGGKTRVVLPVVALMALEPGDGSVSRAAPEPL